jgi:Ca2+-binding EF-hand superfamily protein
MAETNSSSDVPPTTPITHHSLQYINVGSDDEDGDLNASNATLSPGPPGLIFDTGEFLPATPTTAAGAASAAPIPAASAAPASTNDNSEPPSPVSLDLDDLSESSDVDADGDGNDSSSAESTSSSDDDDSSSYESPRTPGADDITPSKVSRENAALDVQTFQRLRSFFEKADTDNNGLIDRNEFDAMAKSLEMDMSEDQVQQLWNEMDADENQQVDFQEFLNTFARAGSSLPASPMAAPHTRSRAGATSEHTDEKRSPDRLFAWVDTDGDGHIDEDELKQALQYYLRRYVV